MALAQETVSIVVTCMVVTGVSEEHLESSLEFFPAGHEVIEILVHSAYAMLIR